MKLNIFQLDPHLTKGIDPIYIVSGDDLLLKHEAMQTLRKSAKHLGFTERTRIAPEAGYNWEQLYLSLYSTSLLAEKRLIELDFRDTTPNKAASKILQEYAQKPAENTVLIIDIGKADAKISKSAWYKALESAGHIVTIWPIPREQLPQWIHTRAKKYGLAMNADAATLLADHVEGNLMAAAQALEKIYLLKPEQTITANILHEFLTDESRFSLFDFIENLIAGNKARTLHILSTLKAEGIEPILVLWGITREIRLLAELAQSLQQGHSYEALFQRHRIFARRQQAVRQFLTRFTLKDCWHTLSRALEIDKILKGAAPGDSWQALELFCLRLT